MTTQQSDTEELLRQAEYGDPEARERLLARHRDRLRKMIAWRLDRRLAARVDPSDVVQEVLLEASCKMDRYLRERPLPFFPWLRSLAGEHLATLHRRHVRARGAASCAKKRASSICPMSRPPNWPPGWRRRPPAPRSGRYGRSCASGCSKPWGGFRSGTGRYWYSATWNNSRLRTRRRSYGSARQRSRCGT